MADVIEFQAIFNSPRRLKTSDDGGGMRGTLDFDETQMSAFLKMFVCAGKSFRFTAELLDTP